jgi:predicted RNA binding protein YcfA (HicA-like mRNA interferase family)
MPKGFNKSIIAKLKRNNFSYLRNTKGSNELWSNKHGVTVLVPKNTKSRHTANKIM